MKKAVVLVRSCPYGMASAGEAYRAISALAGLEVQTTAVLMDDGVLAALKGQDPSGIGMSNLEDAYGMLPEFGAEVVVHRASAEVRGISPGDLLDFHQVDDDGLRGLLEAADLAFTF